MRYENEQKEFLHLSRENLYPAEITPELLTVASLRLSPEILLEVLSKARTDLEQIDGPNLAIRLSNSPEWLGWWERRLRYEAINPPNNEILIPCDRITTVDNTHRLLNQNIDSGLLMMGGGEVAPGHRFAARWVIHHTSQAVLALGPAEWVLKKQRAGYFLPPEVIISLWSYYTDFVRIPDKRWTAITFIPDNNTGLSTNDFFEAIYTAIGTTYSYASADDPIFDIKRARGQHSPNTLIPQTDTLRTTELTQI